MTAKSIWLKTERDLNPTVATERCSAHDLLHSFWVRKWNSGRKTLKDIIFRYQKSCSADTFYIWFLLYCVPHLIISHINKLHKVQHLKRISIKYKYKRHLATWSGWNLHGVRAATTCLAACWQRYLKDDVYIWPTLVRRFLYYLLYSWSSFQLWKLLVCLCLLNKDDIIKIYLKNPFLICSTVTLNWSKLKMF